MLDIQQTDTEVCSLKFLYGLIDAGARAHSLNYARSLANVLGSGVVVVSVLPIENGKCAWLTRQLTTRQPASKEQERLEAAVQYI